MFGTIKKVLHDWEAVTTVEYALLVALIVIVAVGAWSTVGHTVANEVTSVGNTIASAS
jgi:Flp pilus assembly pilin Flp